MLLYNFRKTFFEYWTVIYNLLLLHGFPTCNLESSHFFQFFDLLNTYKKEWIQVSLSWLCVCLPACLCVRVCGVYILGICGIFSQTQLLWVWITLLSLKTLFYEGFNMKKNCFLSVFLWHFIFKKIFFSI